MRLSLLLLSLFVSPTFAEAKVDFKCESVNYSDQISGWIRFGFGGRGHSVQMETWHGFPPITLVDAVLNKGTPTKEGVRHVSEPDRHANDTVATLDLPAIAEKSDSFKGKIEMRYSLAPNEKPHVLVYDLKCVRH